VTNGAGYTVATEQVRVGQCNELPNGLAAGNYTVTESVGYPIHVAAITAVPASDLVNENLTASDGTFQVISGKSTTAYFTNVATLGSVKVCKVLATNAQALSGQTFTFQVNDGAGTQYVSVVAQYGQEVCKVDPVKLLANTTATITELGSANTQLTGVAVIPPQAGTTTSTSAIVAVSGRQIDAAVFTDEALGWVEICKFPGDPSVTGSFDFTVNGTPINPVPVNDCSAPDQVPAGQATINETEPNADYYVSDITADGGSPAASRLVSTSGNSAVVDVPYGGIGNETVVNYTNSTLTGQFKICTAQTSPDAALANDQFTYNWSYTVNGWYNSGSVTLTVPLNGSACSGLFGPLPVINGNGKPVQVTVTAENPTSLIGVDLVSDVYGGNGSVASTTGTTPSNFPWSETIDLGTGINEETFTNGATH
jgi:hypothetical protein